MVILGKDTYATEHLVDDQASAILMEWLSKHLLYLFQHLPSHPGDPHLASYTSGTFMHPNCPSPKMMVTKMLVKMSWLTGRTFQVKQRKAKTTGTLRANKAKHSEQRQKLVQCTLPSAFHLKAKTSGTLQV